MSEILGYARPNGRIGIRNYVAIIYTVHCSMIVAQKLHRMFPVGTQLFGAPEGCKLRQGAFNKIVELAKHPQYAGALVVGLGCEGTEAHMVGEAIAQSGKPVEVVKINEQGGDIKTIEQGSRYLVQLLQHASTAERVVMTPADLIVGTECGGSDATSGLASNPITGAAGDRLIDAGGTYMHSEVGELMGCGDPLAARAVTPQVGEEIREEIAKAERVSFERGSFPWSYGNILGGLTSVDEKSYGALSKSGTHPLQGILRKYGPPPGKGYWIQVAEPASGSFHGDPEGINQFAACGAHLALFTTGCGSTTGGLIPVIKVISNLNRMQLIQDNADLDGTPVIRGEKTVQEMGAELYDLILQVAAGKLTKSEIYQHYEA